MKLTLTAAMLVASLFAGGAYFVPEDHASLETRQAWATPLTEAADDTVTPSTKTVQLEGAASAWRRNADMEAYERGALKPWDVMTRQVNYVMPKTGIVTFELSKAAHVTESLMIFVKGEEGWTPRGNGSQPVKVEKGDKVRAYTSFTVGEEGKTGQILSAINVAQLAVHFATQV